jgi:hypothetical protein
MDEQATKQTNQRPPAADEAFGWTGADSISGEPEGEEAAEAGRTGQAREWITQLENMIQNVAKEAAPVVKEIGAKAAELAAAAAERAGPVAQKAAAWVDEKSPVLAEKSRHWAAELRRSPTVEAAPESTPAAEESKDTSA